MIAPACKVQLCDTPAAFVVSARASKNSQERAFDLNNAAAEFSLARSLCAQS